MTELGWWAVRIRPQQRTVSGARFDDPANAPFQTEAALQRRGFETFLPRKTVFRHANGVTAKKRQKREVPRPLLVGWIFVGWPAGENRWRLLLDCPGVVGVAGCEGRPARVSEAALRRFARSFGTELLCGEERRKALSRAHERERYMRTGAEFAPGQTVRLMGDGPLAGLHVRVVEVAKHQAKILLPLFGTEREVWMDAWLVEAA